MLLDLQELEERIHRRTYGRAAHPDFVKNAVKTRRERLASGRKISDLSINELMAEFLPMAGGASNFNVVLDTTAPRERHALAQRRCHLRHGPSDHRHHRHDGLADHGLPDAHLGQR